MDPVIGMPVGGIVGEEASYVGDSPARGAACLHSLAQQGVSVRCDGVDSLSGKFSVEAQRLVGSPGVLPEGRTPSIRAQPAYSVSFGR